MLGVSSGRPVMSSEGSQTEFALPPNIHNARGDVRRAGFELEYNGVDIERSAQIVRDVFGGEVVPESTFVHRVRGTRFGDFQVEIDAKLLKDKTYEAPLRAVGIDVSDSRWLENALLGIASTVVPIEISAPPIPITRLAPLEKLRRRLHAERARGTRASILYAFGMHINPEIASNDPSAIRQTLRAFVLLYPWLARRAEVDFTRSITPYINPFPSSYVTAVLGHNRRVTAEELIDEYLEHNPTRNRPLDMLPLLTWLDRDRVARRVPDLALVKPRPTYHYRLPNCMIDEPLWTLAREWNAWVAVERLAADPQLIDEMAGEYERAQRQSFKPFYEKWPNVLAEYMRGVEVS